MLIWMSTWLNGTPPAVVLLSFLHEANIRVKIPRMAEAVYGHGDRWTGKAKVGRRHRGGLTFGSICAPVQVPIGRGRPGWLPPWSRPGRHDHEATGEGTGQEGEGAEEGAEGGGKEKRKRHLGAAGQGDAQARTSATTNERTEEVGTGIIDPSLQRLFGTRH